MFMTNCWYTAQQIIDNSYDTDIIFIDGLSFTKEELKEEFNGIRLRYYHSETINHITHHMFTMCPVYV